MKNLLPLMVFVRKYRVRLALALVCLLVSTALSLVVPAILREAIDDLIGRGQLSFVITAAAAVVGASALRGLFGYWNSYLAEAVSQRSAYDLRNAMYDRIQRLSFAFHDHTQTGQLMSRATEDVEALRLFIGRGLPGMAQTLLLFVGVSVVLVVLNWRLAVLTLAFLPLIGFRAVVVGRRLRRIWLGIQQTLGDLGAILQENLTGVRVVKAFSYQDVESRKFAAEATRLYHEELGADRVMAFNVPLMSLLVSLPIALILWYGGRLVVAGELTIGGLTQFLFYLGIMAMPARRLGFLVNLMSRAVSSGQRIRDVLEQRSPVADRPGAIELNGVRGEVSFENVSFRYDAVAPVLRNVSFRAHPGQLVAVVGGSGSGKSTIASLIPRFYDVSEGRITVDGSDVRDVTLGSLRRNIGIVQQDIFLFSASICDNIAYGAVNASMAEIVDAARAAHLHDFIEGLPEGYDTWVGERGVTLSGGEKQRLAVARTLLTDPRILIFDDSTSSVDAETEQAIRQALARLISGRTTFMITHRLSVVRDADLILVLEDGAVVEQGTHRDLMGRNGAYRRIFESQLGGADGPRSRPDGAKACT